VHCQHFYTNPYTTLVARALRLREIGAVRNDVFSEVQANGRYAGGLCLRAPRRIAANSRMAIRNAMALGVPEARLHFLPNVVDTDLFQPAARRPAGPIRILTAGRLVSQKRLDLFLTVLARVAGPGREIRATIVGSGPLRAQLERQASELALLPHRVEFREATASIGSLYQEADLFVLTSAWEGTPNVLLEAMATGVPVVATRVGGVPEIVQHGVTGYLADPDDEGALVSAVQALIDDQGLRLRVGRQAREFVEARHSVHRLPRYLDDLYRWALA
jgi:glycosyltransferase involved in cell wall biosynthesis